MRELDEFTKAYIECALWSSLDESDEQGGEPLDTNYDIDDIAPDTLAEMVSDCESFQRMFGSFIAEDPSRAGHDFWLTRNGHGAGFWDGGWQQPYIPPTDDDWHATGEDYSTVGGYLTAMSKPYGSYNLYVGEDGLIYGS